MRHILTSLIHLIVIAAALMSFTHFSLMTNVLHLAIGYLFAVIGLSVGLHKYFTHSSFKTNIFAHYFLMIISTIVTLGSHIEWAAVHRKHHRFSETKDDPHSPKYHGYKVFFIYLLAPFMKHLKDVEPKYAGKLIRDKDLVFVHNYYHLLIALYIILLFIIDPYLIFPLYIFPVFSSIYGLGLSIVAVHLNGKVQNNMLVHILTGGEGIHEFHHKYPSSHEKMGLSGIIIKLLRSKQYARST